MSSKLIAVAIAVAVALSPQAGGAQDRASEPIVRMTVEPQRVVVGQPSTLTIELLAPNYMTAPPELPTFQVRNAVTRQLTTININERHDDQTYAGVRLEFAITPQEEGAYAVTDQKIRIRYAAEPPATREVEVALPKVGFEAFIPAAAAGLRPFVSATKLTVEQSLERSSEQLRVGDAVTRKITITAQGTPAMLLPPPAFPDIEGLRKYAAQPVLEDKAVGRSGDAVATRIDAATYMLEGAGGYPLPAIDVRWFDVTTGKIETAHAEGASFSVAGGAVSGGSADRSWTWRNVIVIIADNWPAALAVLAAAAGLPWFAPRAVRAFTVAVWRRRTAYLHSENRAFRRLRAARSAATTYSRLLAWLQRFEPLGNDKTIAGLTSAVQDPALEREIGGLQEELFAAVPAGRWSRRALMRRIASARRALRRQSRRDRNRTALPAGINPVGQASPAFGHRRITR
ncbi:hypothetical protein CV770_13325 [Bradyrhizobium sp. AC87j1]|nr:hypothetical protein CV770_13325 [Bradyrhizobium sp. AC87j1]